MYIRSPTTFVSPSAIVPPPVVKEVVTEKDSGSGWGLIVVFLLVMVVGGAIVFGLSSAWPTLLPVEDPVVERAFHAPHSWPDYQIVPQSTQPIQQWWMTPLEEQTQPLPFYPYYVRRFHSPGNPVFM
jgi:hypothetical protein